ncbi:MAG: hypothetical protein F4044_01200 [Rhodobacteraceae bacterium]|nr:hypothetical protein [Paracoccaceae bacterium]
MPNHERITLEFLLSEASTEGYSVNLVTDHTKMLSTIIKNACNGKNRAVLAVVMTLLLKKILSPEQDIRLHQAGMQNGFSGRVLDSVNVTPFLRDENFPYMQSGSGWLTRSLEQAHPYNLDYPGRITPKDLKQAFLEIIYSVEEGINAEECLKYLLNQLVMWREENASLSLAKPTGKRIEDIVNLVRDHWQCDLTGAAKLPVLAIYAVYKCLVSEVARYRNYQLLELLSHTSADSRTDRIADIDVVGENLKKIESVEVKHNLAITCSLVEQLKEKIAGSGLRTFYVLSTIETISPEEMRNLTSLLMKIRKNYGCQVIVNGVACTIRYYLRLLSDADDFVDEYVNLVANDSEIPFELKRRWNELIG